MAASAATSTGMSSTVGPSPATSGVNSASADCSWWNDDSWYSSSTTTSTSEPTPDYPPDYDLFPNVGPISSEDEAFPWVLQLTGSERRLLQEAGLDERSIQRIDDLLQCLEDHQAGDNGPESRWALGRLTQRVDEALEGLQTALNVISRRLQPQGVSPVVRIPRAQQDQLRLFNWILRFSDIFVGALTHQLSTPPAAF